ncbi:MAG: DUF3383 domain-containing protein [Oscillospiraceae bacterium]|jgi:hypothetical protein|nr:DUF3383 domain-containing protein [Oscillospiraceae bacterium]
MANSLDDLVKVEIDINSPVVDSASFDNILIFGAPPLSPAVLNIPAVGTYNALAEITDLGYKATGADADPVGEAARIKFSNSSSPIVLAVQQSVPALAKGVVTKIITSANAETDGIPIGTVTPDDSTLPWFQVEYNRSACDSADVSITKDETIVFGASLPTTEKIGAYLQVSFGTTGSGDKMNLDPDDYPGTYTAEFIFVKGEVTTVIKTSAVYNSDGTWTTSEAEYVTTPLEPFVDTLARALDYDGWWLACEAGVPETEFEECAQLIETQEKAFAYTFLSETDPVGEIYFRSFGVCGLGTNKENHQDPPPDEPNKHVAYAAPALKIHAGGETFANKTVSAVYASDYTGTLKVALESGHSNWIQEIGGKIVTRNGQVRAGEWIDTIRFRDWLKNDMQVRIANLFLTNPKIPYTDGGIALVENQMLASLKSGRDYGGIAPDQFDSEENFYPGFTTKVPLAMNLTASQRNSRKLSGCEFTARLSGAIHLAEIHGSLIY